MTTVESLKEWLRRHSAPIQRKTLERVSNILPDEQALNFFMIMLATSLDEAPDTQLAAVQGWAVATIGHDPALANDWLTVLLALKESLMVGLSQGFEPGRNTPFWPLLDPFFNFALIEVTRLSSERDRSIYLSHVVQLRGQMDRLNRSRANFVSVAAHELKTPLTILEGYANMMRFELRPEQARFQSYLDGFNNGIRRLKIIIDDMLDVTMLDAQSLPIRFQPVYIDKLLAIIATNMGDIFKERRVNLKLHPFDMRQAIYGDPERLSQAFVKIIENALKYTPDSGQVTIVSQITRLDEATADIAGYLDVQVIDTGIGINPEDLDTIFEKFVTAQDVSLHSSGKTKFKGGGPGLGLPIARGIIEAHGGRVWADSQGCDEKSCPGSTFHLEIPLRLRPPSDEL